MSDPHSLDVVTKLPTLPSRKPATHKGLTGRIALFAGSRGMSGAAILAGRGALRGGAGLVRVYTAASVQPILAAAEPCLMTTALTEDREGRIDPAGFASAYDAPAWADVIAIGPGIGQSFQAFPLLIDTLAACGKPLVIDADGLNALAASSKAWPSRWNAPLVLTPHPGEMRRLLSAANLRIDFDDRDQSRIGAATALAKRIGAIVVLKGHRTVVTDAGRVYVNETGNPGMATGGMGDILTGLLAALLGQGLEPFAAAQLAVYCHGAAADSLVDAVGPVGYLASEVADAIPAALALHIGA